MDPYGIMVERNRWNEKNAQLYWTCKNENCHARIVLRKVDPDPEGNIYGLFGCNQHQHPFSRNNKSEIVFKNKAEAEEFCDKNIKMMYRIQNSHKGKDYKWFMCRRKMLNEGYGRHPCQSAFGLTQSFPRVESSLPNHEKPHSIVGIFYHSHKNDEKYHRNEYGGWDVNHVTRAKSQRKNHPAVRNNKLYPLKCRGKYTVEEVLEAQKRGFSLTY